MTEINLSNIALNCSKKYDKDGNFLEHWNNGEYDDVKQYVLDCMEAAIETHKQLSKDGSLATLIRNG